MPYIGQGLPSNAFTGYDTETFTGDGTANKTFTLAKQPFSENSILVTIDGVVQEATEDFTVSGTTLTLVGTAPNNSEVNVVHLGAALALGEASKLDTNGASDQLILDADGDTTISSDTDDQIDFKVGGTDQIKLTDGVLAPTTTNDVDLGSTSLRFKDVAIANDIVHLDNGGTGRTLYDRSANMLGNTGTNLTAYSLYVGGTDAANQLDDYEEGTWTGVYKTTAGVFTMSSNTTGRYVKIGRLVFVTGYFQGSAYNNANTSQTLQLSGLPFTVGQNDNTWYSAGAIGYYTSLATSSGGVPVYYFAVNDDIIVFQQSGISTSDVQGFTAANLTENGAMMVSGCYYTQS